MADQAHEWTDERIGELEVRFHEALTQAANEMQDKLDAWMRDYDRQRTQWLEDIRLGNRTKAEYQAWLKDMAVERSWRQEMVQRLSMDAVNYDSVCMDAINDALPDVYAENANYGAYDVDSKIGYDTGFSLYDRDTVRRLVMDNPNLYPTAGIDLGSDMAWNQRKLTSAVTQGILQGESIPDISKRIRSVLKMDERGAVRAARTACTSAENLGRISSYKRAQSMGIELGQEWVATLDGRTRHTHRLLDGQVVPVGGRFVPEGYGEQYSIGYPGDPTAKGEMVYHCRCCLVASVKGHETAGAERWSSLPKGVTYDDWKSGTYRTDALGEETKDSKRERGVE